MAAALQPFFGCVYASDVHPFGFGDAVDFLGDVEDTGADWIITNPPFRTAAEFVRLGLERASRGVALLLRLQFLEGCERFPLLYGADPLTVCAPFAERVPMTLGRWDPAQSSATAYAWFVWRKGEKGPPRLCAIPPGTRARLTFPNDARRFGYRQDSEMLDAMGSAA